MSVDRRAALLASTTRNGLDYVEVAGADQRTLIVHFVNAVALSAAATTVTISGGDRIPTVAVEPVTAASWSTDAAGRPLLRLRTTVAGDFSTYTLRVAHERIDRFSATAPVSFKVACPADLDCARPAPTAAAEAELPPIDYLAKDFDSLRRALSDFSALRYPDWPERSPADLGMVLLEALSALGDELSYQQDRVAAEAFLGTATQRRSLVQLARLVDYEPRPAVSARVLLRVDVSAALDLPTGTPFAAQAPDGPPVVFESGTGMADRATYRLDPRWNGAAPDGSGGIRPHLWSRDAEVLPTGATEVWIAGHGHGLAVGQQLLVDTPGPTSADPPQREVVHLAESRPGAADHYVEDVDVVLGGAGAPIPVSRLRWSPADALRHDHDLTRTTFAGNLVPATQGVRGEESFVVGAAPTAAPGLPRSVVRTGPGGSSAAPPIHHHTLRGGRLAWLDVPVPPGVPVDPEAAPAPAPEINLTTAVPATGTVPGPVQPWRWARSLVETTPFEFAYTVDAASYRSEGTGAASFADYDSDQGDTVRFGDGDLGEIPDDGSVVTVRYRSGQGAAGNVAADAVTIVGPTAPAGVRAVTNPFPAAGGADEEPAHRVRRRAPYRFRAHRRNAVLPRDYAEAAETLPWVARAGTAFRWTGSWLTVFTTPDPRGGTEVSPERQLELIRLLNRRRLAGYESFVVPPSFVVLDLRVHVCARPDALTAHVRADVRARLGAAPLPDGRTGFFSADRFTFGTPLVRSALIAAVQDTAGVAGVLAVEYRRRGTMSDFATLPDEVPVGPSQIVRLDDDPDHPEDGTLRIDVSGGRP